MFAQHCELLFHMSLVIAQNHKKGGKEEENIFVCFAILILDWQPLLAHKFGEQPKLYSSGFCLQTEVVFS